MKVPIWRNFPTQKLLRSVIQERVNAQSFEIPFADDLISDLIVERHYFCSLKNLRPVFFKKTHENVPYRFYGQFEHGWHPVSWTKCIAPPPTRVDVIVRALRDRVKPLKIAFRRCHPVCAHCRQAPAMEVHHAEPSFQAIVDQVLAAASEHELEHALNTWNWFQVEAFTITAEHPFVRVFDALHERARLESLCVSCHNATKVGTVRSLAKVRDDSGALELKEE